MSENYFVFMCFYKMYLQASACANVLKVTLLLLPPTTLLSLAKMSFPSCRSSLCLLHEMILSAKSNWQLQSLSSTHSSALVCSQQAYKKKHFRMPPSVFISAVSAKKSDNTELNIHSASQMTFTLGRINFALAGSTHVHYHKKAHYGTAWLPGQRRY